MKKQFLLFSLISCLSIQVSTNFEVKAQVTPQQIAEVKSVTSSVVSPNGKWVVYTMSTPVDPTKENSPNKSSLHVLNTSTGVSKIFLTTQGASQIQFRPNKGTITFLSKSNADKTNSIYEMSLDGGEAVKLFSFTNNIASYNWNNNGTKIAFTSIEKSAKPKTSLTFSPTFFEEEFSDRNAYIVAINDKNNTPKKIDVKGAIYSTIWSPNDQYIVITVAPTTSVDDSYMAQAIKIVDAQSLKVTSEINNKGKLGDIVWNPNSTQIAYISAFDINDPTNGSLFLANINGGKPKVIDAKYQGKYEQIKWVNKQQIHFLASESVESVLGTIHTSTFEKKYLVHSDAHHITGFSISENDIFSLTANTPKHPNELFTFNPRLNEFPIRKTFSNDWLNDSKLAKQEIITYKSRDGKYNIQGLFIYPLNYKKGQTYPLITVVHGGPESHYNNGWLTGYSMPGQMGATEGYAVFYPNYRGSTGRGIDFTYSSQGDLAGKEFDDIVDGVDYLINKGIVDKKRVGVTGGSYGGYASAWMSTYYSDRFAAAVMFVGISNNISKFGTSDIPTEMKLVHEREDIWDNWDKYLKNSPIYHVGNAKTPILIMHGAEDPRVHPAQSMELYRHLKVRKPELPVRLIYYPGEGHGNSRSGSKYDYNLRMMQWFNTYLKSGNPKAKMPNLDLPE